MKLDTINELVNFIVSLNATQSKKAADISQHHQHLPCKMTSERKKRPQKSVLLTCNYPANWLVLLIGFSKFNFPHSTTNQKHFPNMPGSNTSSVWNFCALSQTFGFTGKPVLVSRNLGCFLRLHSTLSCLRWEEPCLTTH